MSFDEFPITLPEQMIKDEKVRTGVYSPILELTDKIYDLFTDWAFEHQGSIKILGITKI